MSFSGIIYNNVAFVFVFLSFLTIKFWFHCFYIVVLYEIFGKPKLGSVTFDQFGKTALTAELLTVGNTLNIARMNWAVMLIFCIWVGIVGSSKLIANHCYSWVSAQNWICQTAWDSFTKNISKMAWSFNFIFCTAGQHHDWILLNKFWSLMGFGILCGCSLDSSLFLLIWEHN